MRIPPSVSPHTFTISAFIIGYLMTFDLTILEEVAVANWLGLISQVLGTNSAQELLLQQRAQGDSAITDIESGGFATGNNTNQSTTNANRNVNYNYCYTEREELELVKNALAKIQKQLDEILKD